MVRFIRLFWFALLLALAPLVVTPVAAQEDDGGGFLERLIEDKLSGAGRSVVIRGFQGALSSRATLDELIIADDEGVWLTLKDVVLDWNRSALLRGTLDVTELTAGEILLPRLPAPDPAAPAPEATPFSLPDLPVSVQIDKLVAERVVLGEALFGAAADVSLDGSMSLAGGEGTAKFAIERVDGMEGALTLDASYANASQDLNIALDLTEGADGIVANLMDLPGRPSIALRVDGSGPLNDFAADIGLDTDGQERLKGAVTLTATGEDGVVARQFTADLGGDIAPVFAPQYRPFFGPDIQLTVKGQSLADGRTVLEQLSLKADSLTLDGSVTVGANGLPELIALTGDIAAQDGGPVLLPVGGVDTRVGRIGLDVQFDATKGEDWTGKISITDLDRPDIAIGTVALNGTGRIASDESGQKSVTAGFDFLAEGLQASDPDVQRALGERADGRAEIRWASGEPLSLDSLVLRGASFDLDGKGQVAIGTDGAKTDLTAMLQAADLNAFSGLAGRALGGAAKVNVTLTAAPLDGSFDVAVSGTATDLKVDQKQADAVLAGETALELRADRDETGTRLSRLMLTNAALSLEASGDLTSQASTLDADIRLNDAALLDPKLSGPVDITALATQAGDEWTYDITAKGVGADIASTGKITGVGVNDPALRITTETQLQASDLARFSGIAGRDLAGGIDLKLSGFVLSDGNHADLTVDGSTQDLKTGDARIDPLLTGRVDLSAQVQRNGETVTLPRLSLNAAGAGVKLDGSAKVQEVTSAAPLIDAEVALTADDLGRFSQLAGRDLGGAADLTVKGQLRADASAFDVVVDGRTRMLKLGQETADNLLKGVTEIGVTAKRAGDAIELPRFTISNPQLKAVADGRYAKGESALKADVQIFDLADVEPRMRGTADVNLFAEEVGEAWQVSLDGEAADAVIEAMVEVRDIFEPVRSVSGTARIDASDLSRFAPLAKRPLAGSLSANVEGSVTSDLSQFDIDLSAEGNNLRTGITAADRILGARTTVRLDAVKSGPDAPIRVSVLNVDTPTLTVKADGQMDDSGSSLRLDARLADISPYVSGLSGPVTAQGTVGQAGRDYRVNLSGTGPGGMSVRVAGSIADTFKSASLTIDGAAPLGLANQFIEPRLLEGTVNFDLGLNGPLALSSLSGRVSSSGARAVAPALGIVLENIDLSADLSGSTVRLNMQAAKQDGGRVSVTGPIALSGGYAADLTAVLQGIVVEDPRLYETTVNGTVTVNGPLLGGARIGGTLALGETNLRIPSTGLGATGPIPDGLVHENEPADVRATRDRAGLIDTSNGGRTTGGGSAFPLDLTINAPSRIFVRGRGLDAELGGQLTLRGTTANIIPAGQFDLVRGRLDILGKRLSLDEGSITLQGDFTPVIRLVASTDAGDVKVLIVVEGPALAPEIDFLSQPELPQEEVLARLLFGKSLTSISPLQAAQLASAVAQLAGKGGDGVVSKLREGFGLDDLDITTDDEGNAGLRAGKYLSENVYSDVTVGADGEAEINLNLDLSPSLTVKGGASNSGETSLGIYFEKDY